MAFAQRNQGRLGQRRNLLQQRQGDDDNPLSLGARRSVPTSQFGQSQIQTTPDTATLGPGVKPEPVVAPGPTATLQPVGPPLAAGNQISGAVGGVNNALNLRNQALVGGPGAPGITDIIRQVGLDIGRPTPTNTATLTPPVASATVQPAAPAPINTLPTAGGAPPINATGQGPSATVLPGDRQVERQNQLKMLQQMIQQALRGGQGAPDIAQLVRMAGFVNSL